MAAQFDRLKMLCDQAIARQAEAVWRALTVARPRARYVLGRDSRLLLALACLPDRWRDAALGRLLARDLRRD